MWTLLANIEQQNRIIRKSFFDAFSLYLSYHDHESVQRIFLSPKT